MSTLFNERTPFDLLFRNFFKADGVFQPTTFDNKQPHPLDIFYDEEGLHFEIACTGIDKNDLEILVEGQTLRVNYDKKSDPESEGLKEELKLEYLYKGIAKRSFNLGWKVDPKFDLSKATPSFDNGLLVIYVPFAKGKGIKTLTIK